jgi:prevent-host-death family protein
MQMIDIHEVLERFEKLVEEAAEGKAFIVSVNGVPKAKFVPVDDIDPKDILSAK